MIEEELKKLIENKNTSWAKWGGIFGKERSNFRKTIIAHFNRLNRWLEPLGFEVWIKRKKK